MIALAMADLTEFGVDLDRVPLERAFAGRAEYVEWRDESVDWSAYEAVVIRSTWDYERVVPEFLAWLDRVTKTTPVLNDPALIRWNLDKVYLGDLAKAGVDVVPTRFAKDAGTLARAFEETQSAQIVVKPSVSAGSRLTGRFDAGDPAARALAEQILAKEKTVMVQPYLESVTERGEVAMLHFNGTFSHAIRKGALLATGGGLIGGEYVEHIDAITPDEAQQKAARTVLAGLAAVRPGEDKPLYARVDLVQDDDEKWNLLELELIEPSIFVHLDEAAANRFVDAVHARGIGGDTPPR